MTENETAEAEAEIVQDAEVESKQDIAVATDMLPTTLHLLPLSERPFFPAQALPIVLNEDPWLPTVEAVAREDHHTVGLIMVKPDDPEQATTEDFYPVGTVVRIHHLARQNGRIQFIAQGLKRFRVTRWLSATPPYRVCVEYLDDDDFVNTEELRAYSMAVVNTLKELIPLNPLYSEELKFFLSRFNTNDPSPLADFAANLTTASKEDMQDILSTAPVLERMKKVVVLIKKELEVAKLQTKIRKQVEDKMTEQQRKFFLREQLKVIQQELGLAKDDRTADVERFKERLEHREVPEAAMKRIQDELDKLSILEAGSPEYAVTRNYLDTITDLPWGVYSTDNLDLEHARKILDRDHDGLEDVKDRIIEFLAVGALKGQIAGSILLLVGPPGVGKTSIGRSVAAALGRPFYRLSLGGMRDEAEIKGHRRTYIGALPGKFIQALQETQFANPVIMLDEIDKISASYHGDPASALLEVLDPEQNSDFLDHYLDVRFDLSKVMFICTANQLDTIPGPLLDRMETTHLSGYIAAEKMAIAKNHLWPRLLERTGMPRKRLKLTDTALRQVIEGYAREAGVRNLEKQLGRIIRKAAVKVVNDDKTSIRVGVKNVEDYLGKPPFRKEKPTAGVGVVTGLAWTPLGGATLNIEATRVHTKNRGFKLTGRLGEVMQESAGIAYSYVSSHLREFKADPDFFDEAYVHLHVPEGATPKDGPSAGITMATALLSLARNEKPARPLAMTGELTLTGQVLPIGGVREKIIAARRNKITELLLPEANRGDYEELPDHISQGLVVHFVSHFREVAKLVFSP
ncbi:MAG: endopeptidase La [Candidatus Competibacteraceae bacterium]|jgi:ATP-dependent Lon protease|nr:endopeptidase La [Candidatus Competibacteraceae bacterium]